MLCLLGDAAYEIAKAEVAGDHTYLAGCSCYGWVHLRHIVSLLAHLKLYVLSVQTFIVSVIVMVMGYQA